jgi:hypothetical protein
VTPTDPGPSGNPGLKARARRLAAPVVAKARNEVVKATADDQLALRAEVAELRAELVRQRAEHQAELAAIHEELAALATPSTTRRR